MALWLHKITKLRKFTCINTCDIFSHNEVRHVIEIHISHNWHYYSLLHRKQNTVCEKLPKGKPTGKFNLSKVCKLLTLVDNHSKQLQGGELEKRSQNKKNKIPKDSGGLNQKQISVKSWPKICNIKSAENDLLTKDIEKFVTRESCSNFMCQQQTNVH